MLKTRRIIVAAFVAATLIAVGVWATVARGPKERPPSQVAVAGALVVTVYSSPTCGCCGVYIDYLRDQGYDVRVVTTSDTEAVKERHGVPQAAWSCHTSIVDEYFVEGHVPAEAIEKLLAERPEIDGIALPGMPSGSPGMGGSITEPLEVLAITDGHATPFSTHG